MTPLATLVEVSRRVAETSSRLAKIDALAACLRALAPDEIAIAVPFLSGETRQGRLGIGDAALQEARTGAASQPMLTLAETDSVLGHVAAVSGKGAVAERGRLLGELFRRATPAEQDFLLRLLVGELRQGALEGVMLEAVARAAAVPIAEVRRAAMLAGDIAQVARAAFAGGLRAVRGFSLRVLQPVQPMLAQTAEDVGDALTRLGAAAFEWKLDGARVQVHKAGDEVRVFTRSLNDVTAAVPEVVEAVRSAAARDLVLDGETIALAPGGAPQPFQVTMRRFGRRLDVDAMRQTLPLSVFFFDCLHRDGEALADHPAQERFGALGEVVPRALLVPRLLTRDPAGAQAFFEQALQHGHEGVMAKALDAPYEAGSRGASWLKIKRAHTLDLVVLAAEWGHGRRRGWLSNLHLGARDSSSGGFVMLGKTFKGLTDETLQWQTRELLAREIGRDAYTVHVRPELVVEIAFNELQASPHYPGGLALRFARVKGYRPDKKPEEADTIDTVRAIYGAQIERARGP
ncbi:MAG TPA: ATP-dependent DNA ligase [Burkholderiales bacterium]|nr:ATP-dependent DNA ligase [Burkholderiales bacterium]